VKSVKVIVGGEEYSLIGEDEELIIRSAEEANRLIEELKAKYNDLPILTLTTLALVNVIETLEIERGKFEAEKMKFSDELNKMKMYLEQFLSKDVEN
jgi:cell division protein ZapA (FtsZ GTPase activity inhibitor)